jgi:autotransporter passenger strand-loop-strand repeat protein
MASMFEGASVIVSDGGYCTSIKLNGGKLDILPGAFAEDVTVNPGAELLISSGAEATDILENGGYVYLEDGTNVTFLPNTINDLLLENASATIHSGTTATETTVNSDGRLDIYSGATATKTTVSSNGRLDIFSNGTATGILENGGYVKVADGANVSFVQNTISGLVLSDASATVHAGTVAKSTTVNAGARLDVFSGGKLTGQMMFERGAAVSFEEGGLLDFDLKQTATGTTALVNDLSIIQGTPLYTLSVDADLTAGTYDYALAEGAAEFDTLISVVNEAVEELETLLVGKTIFIEGTSYTLNLNGSVLSVTVVVQGIDPTPPTNLVGTKDRVSWDSTGATGYVVEYSTDGFGHTLSVVTSTTAVDMLELPAGTYQWRVAADNGGGWAIGENIVSDNDPAVPQLLESNADGNNDLFFAKASGTWENIFYAVMKKSRTESHFFVILSTN